MRWLLPLLGAAALAAVVAAPAAAAAPNYMLVSGPGLARPVLFANWEENGRFLSSLVDARRTRQPARSAPRLDLAMFWGWSGRPRPTLARDANQHAWFYPAHGARPAIVDATVDGVRTPRVAPRAALRILARHRVPIRE